MPEHALGVDPEHAVGTGREVGIDVDGSNVAGGKTGREAAV